MYKIFRYLFFAFLLSGTQIAVAQETSSFTINGKVKQPLTIDMAKLEQYKAVVVDSLIIYDQLMAKKSVVKNLTGVLLKDILTTVVIDAETPKKLSEYYVVCTAADNYKIVFSWNELFNTETGNNTLLLTHFESGPAKKESGNMAMITTTDKATGRRFLKGLTQITVYRAN